MAGRVLHFCMGVFSKVVQGCRNFRYDFWGVGGDIWMWLCRHVRRKFPLMLMGGRANGQTWTNGEQGPPSAWAEFLFIIKKQESEWKYSASPECPITCATTSQLALNGIHSYLLVLRVKDEYFIINLLRTVIYNHKFLGCFLIQNIILSNDRYTYNNVF